LNLKGNCAACHPDCEKRVIDSAAQQLNPDQEQYMKKIIATAVALAFSTIAFAQAPKADSKAPAAAPAPAATPATPATPATKAEPMKDSKGKKEMKKGEGKKKEGKAKGKAKKEAKS
jgi:hypothetical protein